MTTGMRQYLDHRFHFPCVHFSQQTLMVFSHQSKTTTRQILNLCIPMSMIPFTPGPTCLVSGHTLTQASNYTTASTAIAVVPFPFAVVPSYFLPHRRHSSAVMPFSLAVVCPSAVISHPRIIPDLDPLAKRLQCHTNPSRYSSGTLPKTLTFAFSDLS